MTHDTKETLMFRGWASLWTFDLSCASVGRQLGLKVRPIDFATISIWLVFSFIALNGSWLQPFTGFRKFIITDDLMNSSSMSAAIVFLKNQNKRVTMLKSEFLQLDISLTYVNVLPIFVDSDSSMMYDSRELTGLSEVSRSFCRNPVPDSLILNHKLFKDYKSQVGKRLCSKVEEGLCPDYAVAGDSFYRRVPKSCANGGRSAFLPSKLYCGGYVHLASLFGTSRAKFKEGPIVNINDRGCRYLYEACTKCKNQICSGGQDSEPCRKQCKYICLQYRAKRCLVYPKLCSRGDITAWTIKTEFSAKDIRMRFNCYLKRKLPDRIFEVNYRVRVPNSTVKSDWLRETSRQLVKDRIIKIGIFKVEYENATILPERIILRGDRISNGHSNRYGFKVLLLKDIKQKNILASGKAFKFMPSKPSLLNLRKWQDVSNCDLLSSWKKYMKLPQPSGRAVKVEKIRNIGVRFAYRIKQELNPTKIKLSVKNDVSVLRTLAKTSFIKALNSKLGGNHKYWRIDITGNITACPGYFQLSVLEKTKMLLVLKQDILVLCPKKYFHLIGVVPKEQFRPVYKARVFIAYAFDGTHVYETRMEKRTEITVKDFIHVSKQQTKKQSTLADLQVLAKFDAISILTGVFVAGLIAIMVFSCLFKPKKIQDFRKRWNRTGVLQQGRNDAARKGQADGDKLESRHLLPIVFLVAIRVAYSFLLTVSFITIIFNAVNKNDLKVLKDFDAFVKAKVNQSNQISLALDQFRESEIRIMTDKAAFLECACDYHVGRIMRNMRDNITALVQMHDLITFDKVSDILIRAMLKRFRLLRVVDQKVRDYQNTVRENIRRIEDKLRRYAHKVYRNKWFSLARRAYGAWNFLKGIEFLGSIGSFNPVSFHRIKVALMRQVNAVKSKLSLSNVIRRLKRPLYPLASVLLAPIRNMKRKVRQAVNDRINRLKNKILRNIPCFGNIDMKKWERAKDDFDETSRKRCRLQAANKFVEKIVDGAKSKKKKSNDFVLRSIRDDAALNILQGDATEEEYESKQENRLTALKRISTLYTQNKDVIAAVKLFRKYSVVFVVIFDILLITYRNLKTYRFAFMMAAGYVIIKEHRRFGESDDTRRIRGQKSVVQTIIHMLTKPILLFFKFFNFIFKLIFTSLIIPVIAAVGIALALFYIVISFTYNGLNVDTLEKLGALELLSSRLDVNYKITSKALKEQATYLNRYDLGMYKESFRVQTEELRNTAKEFNADEIIRIKRVEAELCDIDKQLGCNVNLRNLMEKLEMNIQPCAFPVIKARMPNNIYDRVAYQKQLKYEMKRYVDALRNIIIRTVYIVLGIVATVIFIVVMSKLIFKFLKAMGMIRIKNKHIYHEIPDSIKKRYERKL